MSETNAGNDKFFSFYYLILFLLENLIEIELGYVNIHHPDFLGGSQALISIL